ncbi:taurine catabolism dioxygenase TauD/TfdA [Aspergillus terreus]|uniref:Taurine catabolism dioxygenase TauD/TfdA n=1 Tax=Aspergillus terreus TaxID=33178 RepID=A0A5M3Z7H3_ASPTE|nr:hypothetical protein ATETN484_0011010200 [Aspergillus terreus]GFF18739.1 taurine catabolism dioxygenase TauD/TfdA [Aspergillus terreus]
MHLPFATDASFSHISVHGIHPTFGAEVRAVDFSKPLTDEVFSEIYSAITKYGVLVFRSTGLTDEGHIAFARRFGELDDITPYLALGRKNRLKYNELFDVSNVEFDGSILDPESPRGQGNKVYLHRPYFVQPSLMDFVTQGNSLFHVDSSFNPRRAGYSLLLSHELPPPGMGGATAFADTRTAFDELPADLKADLVANDYVAAHSIHHSRKLAAPEFYADRNPLDYPMGRHKMVQRHEPSGRQNLYIAAHIHHIEGFGPEASQKLFDRVFTHCTQAKYVTEVEWKQPGDLIVWDNTCVMHRSVGGGFLKKYRRDMRRATVHDSSTYAWGLNERTDVRQGLP